MMDVRDVVIHMHRIACMCVYIYNTYIVNSALARHDPQYRYVGECEYMSHEDH